MGERPLTTCPITADASLVPLMDAFDAPVLVNQLCRTRAQAVGVPRGTLDLAWCAQSGLVVNRAFEPEKMAYSAVYENALHFSERFREYQSRLTADLVDRLGVRGKRVVEIGCGDASFLRELCERGGNAGYGFDPSHDAGRAKTGGVGTLEIAREHYDEVTARERPADMVVCRHVLEHVPDPRAMLSLVRLALRDHPEGLAFFEVPNLDATLAHDAFWDLLYEHCVYYTPQTLAFAFESCGFEVIEASETYAGQFATVLARPTEVAPEPRAAGAAMRAQVESFGDRQRAFLGAWRGAFERMNADGRRVVLWGAGTKGVMLLNLLGEVAGAIDSIVDLNPRKHGHFTAGTGHEIVSPEALVERAPSVVVVMNPLYEGEVRAQLRSMGVKAEVLVASEPPASVGG